MQQDLEKLRTEMDSYLKQYGMAVFHGHHRLIETMDQVAWDTDRHPDFREFLQTARQAGARLVIFNYSAFSMDQIDQALDELEDTDLAPEERRKYENRLRQLQGYEGFTCSVELSFSVDSRLYVFEAHTDWYDSFCEVVGEIDAAVADSDAFEEDDEAMGGGYFSKN